MTSTAGITRRHVVAMIVTCLSVLVFVAEPAQAVMRYWNSASQPLKVYQDGVAQGGGYGNWTISTESDGTRSRSTGYIKDYKAGGDEIYFKLFTYVNAGVCIAPKYTSCTQAYSLYDSDGTVGTSSGDWVQRKASTPVPGTADVGRGGFRVYENHGIWPDPKSGETLTLGDAY